MPPEQGGLVGREEAQLTSQPRGQQEHRHAGQEGARSQSSARLLECLIDPEVRDLQAERIHANERVGHVVAEDEIDLGDVRFSGALMAGSWRVEHLLEVDRRLERGRRQFAQADVLNDDVDLVGGGVRQERFDAIGSGRSGRLSRPRGPVRGRAASRDTRAGPSRGYG